MEKKSDKKGDSAVKKDGKAGKVVLGILTLWPLIYTAIFVVFMFSMLFSLLPMYYSKCEIPDIMKIMLPIHFATFLLAVVLIFYYVIHVSKNDRVENDLKPLWVMGIIIANVVVMPVYWFIYIWDGIKKTGGKYGKKRKK